MIHTNGYGVGMVIGFVRDRIAALLYYVILCYLFSSFSSYHDRRGIIIAVS